MFVVSPNVLPSFCGGELFWRFQVGEKFMNFLTRHMKNDVYKNKFTNLHKIQNWFGHLLKLIVTQANYT